MSGAYLILENGTVFKGRFFGYEAEAVGELVFSTGMTCYLETLTDPCHFGQIVLQTFPLIGNFGVIPAEFSSGAGQLKAYIVREHCQEPSNFRSEGNLDTFLYQNKIPGLCGIDTRALTRVIRDNGSMNAMISKTPELSVEQWTALRSYKITGAVEAVSQNGPTAIFTDSPGTERKTQKLALWDFGDTLRSLHMFASQGFQFGNEFGHSAAADEILAGNPDGVVLTDGPGDPAENTRIIKEIKKLCGAKIPIFAVGLGHQMLALANGAKTEKLPFGHHGANQPVRETETGRVFMTAQNHGYAVTPDSLPDTAEMSYINLNDGTCEGVTYKDIPAFSVQFRPPYEARGLFDRFDGLMERGRD